MPLRRQSQQGQAAADPPRFPDRVEPARAEQTQRRQAESEGRERPDDEGPGDIVVGGKTNPSGRRERPEPDRRVVERGHRAGPWAHNVAPGIGIPREGRREHRSGQGQSPGDREAGEGRHERDQGPGRGDLERQARRQDEPTEGRPASEAARRELVPTSEARQDEPKHQGVGLERPAVADHDRERPKRGHRQQGHRRAIASPADPIEPPGSQGRRRRRDQPARRLQTEANGGAEQRDDLGVDRRLDEEPIRERPGVEFGMEEPRAPFQVARDHRRRDLSADVVLDDRLAGVERADRERRRQETPERHPLARHDRDRPPSALVSILVGWMKSTTVRSTPEGSVRFHPPDEEAARNPIRTISYIPAVGIRISRVSPPRSANRSRA